MERRIVSNDLADNYMFIINNRNTRRRCEKCSKLTIKPSKSNRFGLFTVNFEHISHLVPTIQIANFEQVNAGWGGFCFLALKAKCSPCIFSQQN